MTGHLDDGMIAVPGGRFRMGSDHHYPEEAPAREVTVAPFRIDRTPVTNAAFAAFVAATGHVTLAERPPPPGAYPGADPDRLVAGSLVFGPLSGPAGPPAPGARPPGWAFVPGACWRHPEGPGSDLAGRADHPVVHVAHADALAWARWAGKDLPTEAEWERAARGGLAGAAYAWGDAFLPQGRHMANTWQGSFPWQNTCADGHAGTSPVGAFPANGYGLLDMIGNTWEWTADLWHARPQRAPAACCGSAGVACGGLAGAACGGRAGAAAAVFVIKGGSHLCAPNWCRRYRPAARQPEPADTATSHLGFRCIRRATGPGGPAG